MMRIGGNENVVLKNNIVWSLNISKYYEAIRKSNISLFVIL